MVDAGEIKVIAINLTAGLVLLSTDEVIPVREMLDAKGDTTAAPADAAVILAEDGRCRWWAIDAQRFRAGWRH